MDAAETLRKAWEAVNAADLPESLHAVAFESAVSILRVGQAQAAPEEASESEGRADQREKARESTKDGTAKPGAGLMAKLAHESGIAEGELEDVLYFDTDGQPKLVGPARKLGSSKAVQSRAITVVVTAARELALDERETASSIIRDECKRLKCLDADNFAATTSSTTGLVAQGNGRSRLFRLKSGDSGLKALQQTVDAIRGVKAAE